MNTFPKISIRDLREQLQKTAPEGGHETFVGRTVRFFSIYITRVLIATPITPSMINVLSVIVFLTGISLFVFPDKNIQLMGVAVVYLSIVFDACDGELARWRKLTGPFGSAFAEPFSHDVQYAFLFIPFSVGVYLASQDITIIAAGFAGTIAKLLTRFLQVRVDGLMSLYTAVAVESPVPKKRSFTRWLFWIINRNILSSVGMVVPMLIFTLFGRIDLFVWVYALGFLGIFIIKLPIQLVRAVRLGRMF